MVPRPGRVDQVTLGCQCTGSRVGEELPTPSLQLGQGQECRRWVTGCPHSRTRTSRSGGGSEPGPSSRRAHPARQPDLERPCAAAPDKPAFDVPPVPPRHHRVGQHRCPVRVVVQLRRHLRGLPVVLRGGLPGGLHHTDPEPDRAVRDHRSAGRPDRLRGDGAGLPVAPGLRADRRDRPAGAVPHRDLGPSEADHHRHLRRRRTRLRTLRAGQLGVGPAVAQRHQFRHHRRPVRQRRRLLRVRSAALRVGAGVAVRHHRDRVLRRAGRPVPLRRHPDHRPRPQDHLGRQPPALASGRCVRPRQGGAVLVRPVRVAVQQPQHGVHRRVLHRRQRGAAGQADPDVHRGHLRRRLLRRGLPALGEAAGRRAGAAGALRRPHRWCLAADPAERPGHPQRHHAGEGVHRAQHRGHPDGVRHRRRQGHLRALQPVEHRLARLAGRDQRECPERPAARPDPALPDVDPAAAEQELLQLRAAAGGRPVHRRR